jgi:hypothetical protein
LIYNRISVAYNETQNSFGYDSLNVVINHALKHGRTIGGWLYTTLTNTTFILNQKQLIERAKELYPDAKIVPVVFSLDVDGINLEWIENKMNEFGIKRNDLIKQLAIDKSSLSLIISGKRELSEPMRATFFYYFLTYELNRDFRE